MEDLEEPQKKYIDPSGELKIPINSPPHRRPFECEICCSRFKKKHHLKNHLAVHSNVKPFKCPKCGKGFSFRYTLDRHSKIHVENAEEPQKPLFAETKTAIKFSQTGEPTEAAKGPLKPPAEAVRELQAVGITDEFTILEAVISKNRMGITETCSTVWNNCGPSIDSKPGMSTHKDGARENADGVEKKSAEAQTEIFECQICLNPFARTYLPVHSNKKRFKCPQSKKGFILESSLTKHSKIHIDPAKHVKKPQKSPSPQGKIASMLEDLWKPLKSPDETSSFSPLLRHDDVTDKDFKISVDYSEYLNPAEDVKEPQKKDTDPTRELKMSKNSPPQRRPFGCEICFCRFMKKQHLQAHLAVHSNAKPFKCSKCGKGFSFRYTLNRHGKVHARVASRPQETQDDVKTSYFLSQLLPENIDASAKQVEVHVDNADHADPAKEVKEPQNEEYNARPFECQICCRRFKRKHHLESHMSLHTNEKPFKCQQCRKSFTRKTSLSRHIKTHTRPFQKTLSCRPKAPTEETIDEDVNRPRYYLPQLMPRYLGAYSDLFGLFLDDSYYAKEVKEPQNEETDLKSKLDP